MTLNEEQKENDEIHVQYVIKNSRIVHRIDKIDEEKRTQRKGERKELTNRGKEGRSSGTTSDRSINRSPDQARDNQMIGEREERMKKESKTRKRRRISETTESEEEAEQQDRKKKQPKKIIKDEKRSEIAKRNIKFQPRQTSGKFGPKPKLEAIPNGKLLMKPVVMVTKINRPTIEATQIPEEATTSKIDTEIIVTDQITRRADQIGKPIITSIIEIPAGTSGLTREEQHPIISSSEQTNQPDKAIKIIGEQKRSENEMSIMDMPIVIQGITIRTEIQEKKNNQQTQETEDPQEIEDSMNQEMAANVSINGESTELEPTSELTTEMTTKELQRILEQNGERERQNEYDEDIETTLQKLQDNSETATDIQDNTQIEKIAD